MGGFGKDKPAELILDPKSPIFQYFQQTRQPLTQKDLDRLPNFQALSPEENSWLYNLSSEVFIPIHTRAEWIGMIALGPKVSNRPYSDEELTLITTLADQLSLALKNARLVDSLMRVNNDFRRAYQAMEQSNRHFQQALSQLQKIDQTKSDFISIASHELRTPVTIMRGYAEMLLEEPALAENDYHSKMLNGIHLGIMRLNEIIETMLDMASIDARALSLHKADVSLHYLIQSLTKPLQLTLEQRKITLTLEGLSDLPVIQADQEALRKVFNHLILNALQNTPDEGRIFISGLPISPGQAGLPEGGVEVIVSDTGIGIKREYLDLIFTKFYQTSDLQHHSTGKTKFKGSGPGLGLAIAKGIVEAHGGKIWAESPGYDEEKCPGSQFHALLPV
jgi:signal transduction histidine kinase